MMKKVKKRIRGKVYEVSYDDIIKVAEKLEPEAIRHWYVKIGDKLFPPKQIIAEVLGLERLDFTTADAKDILEKLGFEVGRIA